MKLSFKKVLSVLMVVSVILSVGLPVSASAEPASNVYSKTVLSGPFQLNSFDPSSTIWRVTNTGWSITTSPIHPNASLRSPYLAKFKAYDLDEDEYGCIETKEKIDVSQARSVTISFYMYHDTENEDDYYYGRDYLLPIYADDSKAYGIVAGKVYRHDGSVGWKRHSFTFEVPKDSYYLGLRAHSDWGNNIYVDEVTISIQLEDKTPPTEPSISLNNTKLTNKDVLVSVVDGTDKESGVARSEYKIGKDGSWMTYTKPFSVKKNAVVYARTVDKSGLISNEILTNITNIDKTLPQIVAKAKKKTLKNNAKVTGAVAVQIKEEHLGTKTVTQNNKKFKWPKNNKFTKKGKYVLWVTDKAGNKSKFTFMIK